VKHPGKKPSDAGNILEKSGLQNRKNPKMVVNGVDEPILIGD
jgi:hypothetical protein